MQRHKIIIVFNEKSNWNESELRKNEVVKKRTYLRLCDKEIKLMRKINSVERDICISNLRAAANSFFKAVILFHDESLTIERRGIIDGKLVGSTFKSITGIEFA
jgi:hypothetical protein